MAGPLEGVRIIDITSVIAGPFATMILGDLGATVIKIESPRGDDSRHLGPPFMHGTGIPFVGLNRNKYSLCLNLKQSAAIDIVYRLAEGADVFLESNRPGAMERLGLGYEALRQRNPRLIYCSNTPYGTVGPHCEQAGYELAIQGYAGLMYRGDDPPQREQQSIVDISTGMTMIYSILAALYARERTGMGQRIDLSMLGAIMSVQAARFVDGPKDPQVKERTQGWGATYRPYKTQDHWIIVAVLNDNLFRKLCTAIGRPDLGDEPRFASHAKRVEHEQELSHIIGTALQQQPTALWLERLRAEGVPCSPIQPLTALFDDPQIQANGLAAKVEHPRIGLIQTYGLATKFSATPASIRLPAPGLGEHTDSLLEALGYSAADIAALRQQGVLG
jgi:crotonobetainyl-CoA:carnitine CoA-transferase CaiB-like acyl-CoA transferase